MALGVDVAALGAALLRASLKRSARSPRVRRVWRGQGRLWGRCLHQAIANSVEPYTEGSLEVRICYPLLTAGKGGELCRN